MGWGAGSIHPASGCLTYQLGSQCPRGPVSDKGLELGAGGDLVMEVGSAGYPPLPNSGTGVHR